MKLAPGETTYWTATKRAVFYGTTAIVIYTDGEKDYVFGATHPRSGQSEVALGSTSLGVNFINILHTIFLYERQFGSFFYVHVTREKLPKQRLFEKFVRKMLMKLIIGQLRGSEEKAHEFYDNNKTKLSIHNAPYQKAVMGRDVNNIVTVEFTFV